MESATESNNISDVSAQAETANPDTGSGFIPEATTTTTITTDVLLSMDQENPPSNEEDDLEEGELKDDDDDEEEEEEEEGESQEQNGRSSKSESDSPKHPSNSSSSSSSSSSASSSSSSSTSKEQSSSKSSSRIGSHHSSSSRNNLSGFDSNNRTRLVSTRQISEDRYRHGRDREDPSEKAAKLISMRTKLLEARSREIELKFQKNKNIISSPPPPPPNLISSGLPRNVNMTIAKPSISYSENPNPKPVSVVDLKPKKSKVKSKHVEKKVKKKAKKKKKKKTSTKKHGKHKSSDTEKKSTSELQSSDPQELDLPIDNLDHQGPRTPPDNHVLTLEDEQIEWPSHLIRMTMTQPSISYSVNPGTILTDSNNEDRKDVSQKKRRDHVLSPTSRKKNKGDDKDMEYTWFYNYFVSSFGMDHNQAQHQAHSAVFSVKSNDQEISESSQVEGTIPFRPIQPKFTIIKSEKEITLPNGQVLPPGTVQKIVHPYPRRDSEILGPLFDFY